MFQCGLEALTFSHVLGENERRVPSIEGELMCSYFHVQTTAVLGLVRPDCCRPDRSVTALTEMAEEFGSAFGRAEIEDRHLGELFAGVPVLMTGGVIHPEEPLRFVVEDPHRIRIVIEEHAEALLTVTKFMFELSTFGDVATVENDALDGGFFEKVGRDSFVVPLVSVAIDQGVFERR